MDPLSTYDADRRSRDDEPPVSGSVQRGIALLGRLRHELELEVHLASSDAREEWSILAPKLQELERFRDASVHSVDELRDLIEEVSELHERVHRAHQR
ncbi:MAG: hypothetical protein HYV09_29410 [Deltaproteobacteria bacterium]|nr:hypothetical protein [Deltaproteobacteria bacterium]